MFSKPKFAPQVYWLVHPLALAFYVFLIMLYFLPDYFEKYELELISSRMGTFTHEQYSDLNNNGHEEYLITAYNAGTVPKVLLHDHHGKTINQWNFKGKWLENRLDLIGDYDNNKSKEIYCLTYSKDSIFLNIVEPFNQKETVRRSRFIDWVGIYNHDKMYINFVDGKLIDTNDDGFKEYVFILYAGFSKFPRKVYVYDIKNDKLQRSQESAAGISVNCFFQDINNDGIDEVCGKVTAHENIHYPMPYTDSSSWVMVFNLKGKVDFLFPPIEEKTGIGSEIVTMPFRFDDTSYFVSTFFNRSAKTGNDSIKLKLFDIFGNFLHTKSYFSEAQPELSFLSTPNLHDNIFYMYDLKGNIYKSDTSLILDEHFIMEENEKLSINLYQDYHIDINQDSKDEYILMAQKLNQGLIIYSSELKDAIYIDLPSLNGSSDWKIFSKGPTKEDPSNIIVNGSKRIVKLRYSKNQSYIWEYPIYIAFYLFLFLLFWLLQKVQLYFAKKSFEIEKQLMQQQMALSKKQMEPHFMLNTVNNIGYLFIKEDKKKAMFYLGKFAALMRRGLMNVDKIATSLEEELEFVEDYLVLQKQLMDGGLDYKISLEENIEEDKIQIPHSLIYTFVENAIKHGLRPKKSGRRLRIQVSKEQEKVKIAIQDNGVGRQKSKELKTTDTGKGMEIVMTIIAGYNQLHGGNISYLVEDVLEDGDVKGTIVVIWV